MESALLDGRIQNVPFIKAVYIGCMIVYQKH